jgi:hypothetical protein
VRARQSQGPLQGGTPLRGHEPAQRALQPAGTRQRKHVLQGCEGR